MQSRWWQPSVEDYYSPFDPHFDESADSDDNEDEEDELEVELTRGDFNVLSPELLMRISGFLDLESLCRGAFARSRCFCIARSLTHVAQC